MQQARPFRPVLRHATVSSYRATYLIPFLFVVCEVYRLGNWLALNGADFSDYGAEDREYVLMLGVFALQALAEAVFLAIAWAGRHERLMHRFTDVALGLFSSSCVLAFDYGLKVAF